MKAFVWPHQFPQFGPFRVTYKRRKGGHPNWTLSSLTSFVPFRNKVLDLAIDQLPYPADLRTLDLTHFLPEGESEAEWLGVSGQC